MNIILELSVPIKKFYQDLNQYLLCVIHELKLHNLVMSICKRVY